MGIFNIIRNRLIKLKMNNLRRKILWKKKFHTTCVHYSENLLFDKEIFLYNFFPVNEYDFLNICQ